MKPIPVFELADTHGVPFDILGVMLKERALVPDWEDFMRGAIRQGWLPKKIFSAAQELATPLGFWDQEEFQAKLKLLFVQGMENAR